jgi:hypothetical protein
MMINASCYLHRATANGYIHQALLLAISELESDHTQNISIQTPMHIYTPAPQMHQYTPGPKAAL